MCSFRCLPHVSVFQKKTASAPRIASLLWYRAEDLNLRGKFDCNIDLTTKCAVAKVSDNAEEDKPLSQARVDTTNSKNNTHVDCVTKNSRRLIRQN